MCDKWQAGILFNLAIFNAPDFELLLITSLTHDLIIPVFEAFIIALKSEPLPEARTHKFSFNTVLIIEFYAKLSIFLKKIN